MARRLAGAGIPLVQGPGGDGFEVGGVGQDTIEAFSSRKTAVEQGVWVEDGRRRRGCGCVCDRGTFCGGCGHERCRWTLARGMRDLVDAYIARYGRAPSRAHVWALHEQAFRSGRKPKDDELVSPAEQLARWEEKAARHGVQALASIPGAVALYAAEHGATSRAVARLDDDARHRAIRIAVAEVQRQNATWNTSDLMWEIQAALPPLAPEVDSTALMEQCLREALGNEVEGAEVAWLGKRPGISEVSVLGVGESDGQSRYRKPNTDRYCTIGQLDTEGYLLRAAARTMRPKMTDDEAADALGGSGLSEEQLAAGQMLLSSDRPTIVFVGPAGTGKSFTLAALAKAYIRYSGKRVIGLALAKNAVRVLQGEGIDEAYTIADFLGQLKGGGSRGHIEIGQGDILVIDESSQVPTEALAQLQSIASQACAWTSQAGGTEEPPSPQARRGIRV